MQINNFSCEENVYGNLVTLWHWTEQIERRVETVYLFLNLFWSNVFTINNVKNGIDKNQKL